MTDVYGSYSSDSYERSRYSDSYERPSYSDSYERSRCSDSFERPRYSDSYERPRLKQMRGRVPDRAGLTSAGTRDDHRRTVRLVQVKKRMVQYTPIDPDVAARGGATYYQKTITETQFTKSMLLPVPPS